MDRRPGSKIRGRDGPSKPALTLPPCPVPGPEPQAGAGLPEPAQLQPRELQRLELDSRKPGEAGPSCPPCPGQAGRSLLFHTLGTSCPNCPVSGLHLVLSGLSGGWGPAWGPLQPWGQGRAGAGPSPGPALCVRWDPGQAVCGSHSARAGPPEWLPPASGVGAVPSRPPTQGSRPASLACAPPPAALTVAYSQSLFIQVGGTCLPHPRKQCCGSPSKQTRFFTALFQLPASLTSFARARRGSAGQALEDRPAPPCHSHVCSVDEWGGVC